MCQCIMGNVKWSVFVIEESLLIEIGERNFIYGCKPFFAYSDMLVAIFEYNN